MQHPYEIRQTYETPYGAGYCNSTGSCGDTLMASFDVNGVAVRWTSDDGFATWKEIAERNWKKAYSELSKRDQFILSYGFPEIEKSDDFMKLDSPLKLVLKSAKKAIKAGLIEADVCTRCGGGGKYSYCERFGHMCFKCEGNGKQLPPLSKVKKAILASQVAA